MDSTRQLEKKSEQSKRVHMFSNERMPLFKSKNIISFKMHLYSGPSEFFKYKKKILKLKLFYYENTDLLILFIIYILYSDMV